MLDFLPHLQTKPILIRISVLILIIAVSMVLTMVVGILIALPFFGFNLLEQLTFVDDFTNMSGIHLLKYFQVVNQFGVFILPAFCYAYLHNRQPGKFLHLNQRPSLNLLIVALLLILVSIPAINWMVEINQHMQLPDFFSNIEKWMQESEDKTNRLTEAFLSVSTLKGLAGNLIIIALLAAIGEELLFRGVILQLLISWMKNKHIAILLSAILFSALHMQFYGFLPRMILGILFGYIFIWSGSLWIPIILHFLFNGITVVGAYLYNIGIIDTDVESIGSTDNRIVILTSFLLGLLLMFVLSRLPKKKDRINYDLNK